MMLKRHANLAGANVSRSHIDGRYYMRLVLPVMALLVFMAPASRPIVTRTIERG